jgi:hypothetical protein
MAEPRALTSLIGVLLDEKAPCSILAGSSSTMMFDPALIRGSKLRE